MLCSNHHRCFRTILCTSLVVVRAMSAPASSPTAKAAIAQLTATSSKFENLMNIASCAATSRIQGASMLFLPECFGFMGSSGSETIANAENLESDKVNPDSVSTLLESIAKGETVVAESGPVAFQNPSISIINGLKHIARASNLWISGGGIHEYIDGHRVYNTHVILNNEGEIVQKYRKIHLFDVSIPGRVELKESNTTSAGSSLQVCRSPIGMLGLTTCYDVRFPEQYTELVKLGAEVILVPSAFTVPTGTAHWHVLLRARAIETQCYVLAAAQVGRHNDKRESYGHSMAVDPWGKVLVDAADERAPVVVTCEIDLELLRDVRQRIPIQQHRKAASTSTDGTLI